MEIKLLGALDYAKLKELLKDKVENSEELVNQIKQLEREQRVNIVSASGRLSRFPGEVFEILGLSEEKEYEKNLNFIKRVVQMGHDSITDHDYCVFALQNITVIIEQIIIAERFSSFTIKSRREVDFSKSGFYTPNFHDKNGKVLLENETIKKEYQEHMNSLFQNYEELIKKGATLEDARFVLPYCYYSNIIMGVDAHTLKDMIIKFTKTKYAKIEEVYEFGMRLKEIAKKEVPYIIPQIDAVKEKSCDSVDEILNSILPKQEYTILPKAKLIHCSANIDDTILISSIMRRYQFDYDKSKKIYESIIKKKEYVKEQIMRKIAFESDKLELTQVNFQFQIPISYAVLTHLTRHRTHDILIPDFAPVIDLLQYKIPPKIKDLCQKEFTEIFQNNHNKYLELKEKYQIREEDLIYFTLSGNLVNVVTNMNGKTLEHILRLRECTKAQWETREIAYQMHEEIRKLKDAVLFQNILGSTCETQHFCKEGKESCGKIIEILKNNSRKNNNHKERIVN